MKNAAIIIGLILVFIFIISAFGDDNSSSKSSDYTTTTNYSTSDEADSDETESYDEEEETDSSLGFNGYECTDDCSGHEAGYEWAEEHGITQYDVDNYSGNSNSFMEGMQSYVDENW